MNENELSIKKIKEDFEQLYLVKTFLEPVLSNINLNTNPNNLAPRIVSALSETIVLNKIKEISVEFGDLSIFHIPESKSASFYDICFKYKNRYIYANIKITDMRNKGDNSSGWGPIYYVLTGETVNVTEKSLDLLSSKINLDLYDLSLNYYFIVIDKNTGKIILNSLKTLSEFISNPANPPYQINWTKNMEPKYDLINRNQTFFLTTAIESFNKKIINSTKRKDVLETVRTIIDSLLKN
jgi:hypothetical protein